MSLPTVDVHQHLWPEALVAGLSSGLSRPACAGTAAASTPDHRVDLDAHGIEHRLQELDAVGTDVALVSLQPTLGLGEDDPLVAAYHEGCGGARAPLGGTAAAARLRRGAGRVRRRDPRRRRARGRSSRASGRRSSESSRLGAPSSSSTPDPRASQPRRPAGGARWSPTRPRCRAPTSSGSRTVRTRSHGSESCSRSSPGRAVPARTARLARRRHPDHPPRDGLLDTASYGRRALELAMATFGIGQLVFGSDVPVLDAAPGLRALGEFGNAVADAVRRENPSLLLDRAGAGMDRPARAGRPRARPCGAGRPRRGDRARALALGRPDRPRPARAHVHRALPGRQRGRLGAGLMNQQDTATTTTTSRRAPCTSARACWSRIGSSAWTGRCGVAREHPVGNGFDFDAGLHPPDAPCERSPRRRRSTATRPRSGAWGTTPSSTTTACSTAVR